MGEALNKLAAEDPSFRYSRDEESNQTVIEGMGDWAANGGDAQKDSLWTIF